MSTRTKKKKRFDDTGYAMVMLAPNFFFFVLFMLFPIVWTFILSFTEYDLITPIKWVGAQNYIQMFTDEIALECLKNTILYSFMSIVPGICISLFLAVLLDSRVHFKKFFRAAFFIPSITSWVVIAVVWQWLYNQDFGLINYLLSFLGIAPIPWLTSGSVSLLSLAIVTIWKNAGYHMLLFLSGLQSISDVYYEASELDGAGKWQQFRHITLPLLSPTTFFVFITSIINSFQSFDIVMLMTKGGPGRSSSVLVHYLYQNAFKYFKMGYASALAYLLFGIIMVITVLNMRFEKKSHDLY